MLTRIGCKTYLVLETTNWGCPVICLLTRIGCETNLVLRPPTRAVLGSVCSPGLAVKQISCSRQPIRLLCALYAQQDWLGKKSRNREEPIKWFYDRTAHQNVINFMFEQPIRLLCDLYAHQDWLWKKSRAREEPIEWLYARL